MEGRPGRRWKRILIAGVASLVVATVLGLSLSYLFVVVRDQPLTAGGMGSGAQPARYVAGPRFNDGAEVVEYVDGETVTVEASIRNQARYGVTLTGVHTDPASWAGLVRLAGARPAVMQGPAPCCIVDDVATWAASGFTPLAIPPGDERVVVLHLVVGHCEDNGIGASNELDGIAVDYQEMGWHGTQVVPLTTPLVVHYTSGAECPRPHPTPLSAPPNAAPRSPSTPG